MAESTEKPIYGSWVSTRLVWGSAFLCATFLALSFFRLWLVAGAAPFAVSLVYFLYARFSFSSRGRDIQAKLWRLVVDRLDWNGVGTALDIGCGNGALAVEVAGRHPRARVVGIDTWGKAWDYGRRACERNAALAGVGGRVSVQEADAAHLPFADGSFDAAVSNFVFHEVRGVRDKRVLIREALRVVRKGGCFAFQDLFLARAIYGDQEDLVRTIKGWGVSRVEILDTSVLPFIPRALKLPFMLGKIGIISGTK